MKSTISSLVFCGGCIVWSGTTFPCPSLTMRRCLHTVTTRAWHAVKISPPKSVATTRRAAFCSASSGNHDRPMQKFITQKLAEDFEPLHLDILNESHGGQHLESHFKVVIVADKFKGKPLLQQHRMVKASLQNENGELPFHSLSIVSFEPDKWQGAKIPASPRCAGGDGPK